MDHVNFFGDIFESIPDYRELVLLLLINRKDDDSINGYGIQKIDIKRLMKKLKK